MTVKYLTANNLKEILIMSVKHKFNQYNLKWMHRIEVAREVTHIKQNGLIVGFTNGCFDLLHSGHTDVINFAAEQCDFLIVGVNSDISVKTLKGKDRPIQPEADRINLMSLLEMVDVVVTFNDASVLGTIETIKPDIIIKGGDYKPHQIVGHEFVKSYGGKVMSCPLKEGVSTTKTIEKIQKLGQ